MKESEQITKLREEIKEWEQSFDLFHDAVMRGTMEYRKINPNFPILSLPDTGKMINALCDEILKLRDNNIQKWTDEEIIGFANSYGTTIQRREGFIAGFKNRQLLLETHMKYKKI